MAKSKKFKEADTYLDASAVWDVNRSMTQEDLNKLFLYVTPNRAAEITDWNSVKQNGVFMATASALNAPVSGAYSSGIMFKFDSNGAWGVQLVFSMNQALYVRYLLNGKFGSWTKVI